MNSNKPFVLSVSFQEKLPTLYTIDPVLRYYATKQGLMQAAHYWAKFYQRVMPDSLWQGGYYQNYVLYLEDDNSRYVMHAYQNNATRDFQSLSQELTSIVLRKGLGEDVRGDAYKNASSSKAGK